MGDGLGHRHGLLQVGKLGGHDAAHRVVGVVQKLVDEFAGVGAGGLQHPLYHVGGQLLQHVHRIVHVQLLHDRGDLLVGGRLDNDLLGVRLQIGEHLRCHLLGQGAEHHHDLVLGQLLQELGDIDFVLLQQGGTQRVQITALQQLQQRLNIHHLLLHWKFLLFLV